MGILLRSNKPCPWCSSSDAYCIYTDSVHCFSCGRGESKNSLRKYFTDERSHGKELPEDLELPMSKIAVSYLNQFDPCLQFNNTEVSLSYSPTTERLYFIYPGGWHARAVDGQRPKWVTGGEYHIQTHVICEPSPCNITVLVEDIISSIVIAASGPYEVICLGGTKLFRNTEQLLQPNVIIWLDPDKPGQDASKKLENRLGLAYNVRNIQSNKDPKWYSRERVQEILYDKRP